MDFHCRSRGHKPKKDEGVPCKKWALIEFLFLLCMEHLKSTKLCLASNRNSLRCDYVCENKDDVWVHKRVSFFIKDLILDKIFLNFHFLTKDIFSKFISDNRQQIFSSNFSQKYFLARFTSRRRSLLNVATVSGSATGSTTSGFCSGFRCVSFFVEGPNFGRVFTNLFGVGNIKFLFWCSFVHWRNCKSGVLAML